MKNLYVVVLPIAKHNEREAAHHGCAFPPLALLSDNICPSQAPNVLCMLLIIVRCVTALSATGARCEVLLLLDQIKPIGQLVPVN